MCPNSRHFSQKGMALPKASFGSLHLFWDWMTLKAPKLFHTIVHAGLVGPSILTHYRLRTEKVQSEWKCFTSPCGGFHPTRAGYQLPLSFLWPGLLPHGVNVCIVFYISECVRKDKNTSFYKLDIPQFIKTNKEDHIYKY